VDGKGVEVPAVDPDDLRARVERDLELTSTVDLDQRTEVPFRCAGYELTQFFPRERADDEENCRSAGRARLEDLQLVQDEILSQHGHRPAFNDCSKIVERAAEIWPIGEDGDGRGTGVRIGGRVCGRVQVANQTGARRTTLHLGDNRDCRPPERAAERARAWG